MLKILSVDGGGTRGIIPATILSCIAKDTGKQPLELFDLFAGASTGGIICIGLMSGITPEGLADLYLNKAGEIFDDSWWDDVKDFGKKIGADYSQDNFKKILKGLFKDKKLGGLDKKKTLMVTTFELNPVDNGKPVNFRAKVYNSNFIRDKDVSLIDLALMTSAGPTYFPIYKDHIDGGVAINHPAMAAVAFAINQNKDGTGEYCYPDGKAKGLNLNQNGIKVLSLNCGTSNKSYIPDSKIGNGNWGELQWVKYLPDLLTESNVQVSEYYVRQVLPESNYLRIELKFDDPNAPVEIKDKIIGLDEKRPEVLRAMKQFAEEYYQDNQKEILAFLDLPVV